MAGLLAIVGLLPLSSPTRLEQTYALVVEIDENRCLGRCWQLPQQHSATLCGLSQSSGAGLRRRCQLAATEVAFHINGTCAASSYTIDRSLKSQSCENHRLGL